jgi:T5orf172 domain
VELGKAILVAVIRKDRTRFYKIGEGWLHTFKQRFPNDELLYVYCGGDSPTSLLNEVNPVQYTHKPRRDGLGWYDHPYKVDHTKPFQPKWHRYDIKQAHLKLLKLVGNLNATVHSYIPEPNTDYGFMYAFEHRGNGWIKIGMTNRPDETYCWTRIHHYCKTRSLPENGWAIIGVVKSSKPNELENRMHRRLRQYRVTQDDGETELFKCGVLIFEAALVSLNEFIVGNKPRTIVEALAYVAQFREKTTQDNEVRRQQLLKAEKNRKNSDQRRQRELEQRAVTEKLYREEREAENKALEISRLDEELARLQLEEHKPKWFDFGGKARRRKIANAEDRLKELESERDVPIRSP